MTEPTYLLIKMLGGYLIGTRLPGQYNDSEVVLKDIMDIVHEEEGGALFYSMAPHFILYENEPVTFNTKYILEQSVPSDSLVEIYKKSFNKYLLNYQENNKGETTKEEFKNNTVKIDRGRLN